MQREAEGLQGSAGGMQRPVLAPSASSPSPPHPSLAASAEQAAAAAAAAGGGGQAGGGGDCCWDQGSQHDQALKILHLKFQTGQTCSGF